MRRENRKNNAQNKTLTDKIILYSLIGVAILAVIVFALFLYSKSLSDDMKNSAIDLEKFANRTNNNTKNNETNQTTENTQSASTEIGKTVEQSQNELNSNNTINNNVSSSKNTTNVTKKTNNSSKISNTKNTTTTNNSNVNQTTTAEPKKELAFVKPVEGEIVKEYARDNLIYSETLQEWTTHFGIDIKADKTTVVNAAEAGTIKSIKNDPRYGLTVVIEHDDNYQTVYSNLLTSEFVVEGEKVEKGQAIGTVGNTAPFEIADDAHLHFEILKDSLQIDPKVLLKM